MKECGQELRNVVRGQKKIGEGPDETGQGWGRRLAQGS